MSFEIVPNKTYLENIISLARNHCKAFSKPYPRCIFHCREYIEINERDTQYILGFLPVSNISVEVEHIPMNLRFHGTFVTITFP